MSGGSLGPGFSCTFTVDIDIPGDMSNGVHVNTTDAITTTVDAATVSGNHATDDFAIVAAPSLTKEFTDDPVPPGGTVTLEFTLTQDALAPAELAWAELRDALETDGRNAKALAPQLAPALAGALLRLEQGVHAGRLEPHASGASAASVVLEVARAAGARPDELSRLTVVLRETLPPLLRRSALASPSLLSEAPPAEAAPRLPQGLAQELRHALAPGLTEARQ